MPHLSDDRRHLHPVHDMSTARSLGDWFDRHGLDGGHHGSGHEAELPASISSEFRSVAYLTLGWVILVAMRPPLASVNVLTAVFVGAGGVLYCIGIGFHVWRALPFQDAPWHSFVLVAASCHYTTILRGVVLARL
jgi:hypothetical protein